VNDKNIAVLVVEVEAVAGAFIAAAILVYLMISRVRCFFGRSNTPQGGEKLFR